jgi:hypothetical protein
VAEPTTALAKEIRRWTPGRFMPTEDISARLSTEHPAAFETADEAFTEARKELEWKIEEEKRKQSSGQTESMKTWRLGEEYIIRSHPTFPRLHAESLARRFAVGEARKDQPVPCDCCRIGMAIKAGIDFRGVDRIHARYNHDTRTGPSIKMD